MKKNYLNNGTQLNTTTADYKCNKYLDKLVAKKKKKNTGATFSFFGLGSPYTLIFIIYCPPYINHLDQMAPLF